MITLVNKTHSYHFSQKTKFDVSQRGDFDFDMKLRSDWQFRIYAEMLYRKSMGYNCYFFTLTFNDEFLPKLEYDYEYFDGTFKHYESSAFDSDAINYFTTTLRNELLRLHKVTDISYIICPEFGKKGTVRPHYHGLLCVPSRVSDADLLDLVKKSWSVPTGKYNKDGSPIRKMRGWVLPDKPAAYRNNGKLQKPFKVDEKKLANTAIYVSKYCTKQVEFFNKPVFRYIKKKIQSEISKGNDELKQYLSKRSPRIKVSLHFGECINDMYTFKNLWWKPFFRVSEIKYDTLYYGVWTPLNRKRPTSFPFYNRRKLLFESIKESCVVTCVPHFTQSYFHLIGVKPPKPIYRYDVKLSAIGKEYLPYEYSRRINDLSVFYRDVATFIYSTKFVDWCKDNNFCYSYILDVYKRTDSLAFAVYDLCYKDRVSPLHLADFYSHPEKYQSNKIIDNAKIVGSHRVSNGFYFDVRHDYNISHSTLPPFVPLGLPTNTYFYGNESIDKMCRCACSFYLMRAENVSMPNSDLSAPYDIFNIHFNSFPCFRGFDELILSVKKYKRSLMAVKCKLVQHNEDIKKELIDKYWNNGI